MNTKNLSVAFLIAVLAGFSPALLTPHFGVAQSNSTSQAQVLTCSWYVAPSNTYLAAEAGDLIVVGEIQNVGSNIIANATVEGTALDSNGNVLATSRGVTFVFHTLPGQRAPFYIDFTPASASSNDLSWMASVKSVTVQVYSVTDTTSSQYSKLSIPFGGCVGTVENNDTYTVVGFVENTGAETVGDVWVVTTFYDAAGTVVALNFTNYLTDSLAPQAQVAFWASPADNTLALSSKIANYTVQIDSLPLSGSPSGSPNSTSGASNGSFPIVPVVVASVLVVAVVVAFVVLKKRRGLPPPPPPPPPSTP